MRKLLFTVFTLLPQFFLSLLRRSYRANLCGHKTKLKGVITIPGEKYVGEVDVSENGNPDYCLACIGKMNIQCAWCENRITIGDSVTLYLLREGFEAPEHAVHYSENGHDALVGCLGLNCAHSGADVQGVWLPPGMVQRVPSPIELCLHGKDGQGSCVVLVGDTNSYPGSVSLHRI